jgi:DNA/RNA-binding domain of Phe-tRNA-synthetase-like protein
MLIVTEKWKQAYPGAFVGVLAMNHVVNPPKHAALDERKAALEAELRAKYAAFDRPALRALPVLQAYHTYYKRFKKTYHVQLQLESVVHKGKSIPQVAALVEAMFMAELEDQMLTAGHDLDVVQTPVRIDVADGSGTAGGNGTAEGSGTAFGSGEYVRINGRSQQLAAGDMFIADTVGVLSSVVHGPDQRTQITEATIRVLFTVYAPPGIGETAVHTHLQTIQHNVNLFAPQAEVEVTAVYGAGL